MQVWFIGNEFVLVIDLYLPKNSKIDLLFFNRKFFPVHHIHGLFNADG
jgi:hypothetical protein